MSCLCLFLVHPDLLLYSRCSQPFTLHRRHRLTTTRSRVEAQDIHTSRGEHRRDGGRCTCEQAEQRSRRPEQAKRKCASQARIILPVYHRRVCGATHRIKGPRRDAHCRVEEYGTGYTDQKMGATGFAHAHKIARAASGKSSSM